MRRRSVYDQNISLGNRSCIRVSIYVGICGYVWIYVDICGYMCGYMCEYMWVYVGNFNLPLSECILESGPALPLSDVTRALYIMMHHNRSGGTHFDQFSLTVLCTIAVSEGSHPQPKWMSMAYFPLKSHNHVHLAQPKIQNISWTSL